MKFTRTILSMLMLLFIGATMATAQTDIEKEIPLSDVPENVIKAAKQAVPGVQLTGAEVEKTRAGLVYDLLGTSNGERVEIEVTADGKVTEIERGDEEDDDDDDDGDDDGGDDDGGDDDPDDGIR